MFLKSDKGILFISEVAAEGIRLQEVLDENQENYRKIIGEKYYAFIK